MPDQISGSPQLELPDNPNLEWLRKQSEFSALPVIVLTASAQTRDIELAYKLGANSYLVKPVNDQSMVEMIKVLDMYWLLMNTPLEGKAGVL